MKIRVKVSTNKVGSEDEDTFEIADDELEGLSEDDRNKAIEETAQQVMFEMIDWYWEPVDEEDD